MTKCKVKLESASVFEVINRMSKLDNIPLTLHYDIIHTLKALQRENERLKTQAAQMREALENITEYWNGDSNEIAMMDACTNNRETAHEAIAAIDKIGGQEDG